MILEEHHGALGRGKRIRGVAAGDGPGGDGASPRVGNQAEGEHGSQDAPHGSVEIGETQLAGLDLPDKLDHVVWLDQIEPGPQRRRGITHRA